MTSVFNKFRESPFFEIERNACIYNKIKDLLVASGASKSAAMQLCVVCGETPDNYDLPLLGKCVLGHQHKGCCMGLRQLLCAEAEEEENGGLPISVKAHIARTVMRKGTHEALFVAWLEMAKLVSRAQWTWSRPTLDQLREWFPSPDQASGALVFSPPPPPPLPGALFGVAPPQAMPAYGQPLPPLRDVLGGSAMPSAMPTATPSLADALSDACADDLEGMMHEAQDSFDFGPDSQEGDTEVYQEDQEDAVDPSLSASQREIEVKKEYTAEELMQNDFQMCFEVLGVASFASLEQIKRGFFRQALRVHPDKTDGSEEGAARFRLLQLAYKLAFELRERADFGISARRARQTVDLCLLRFVPLPVGESEKPFKEGGVVTNCDISAACAIPCLYKGDELSPRARTIAIGLNQKLADYVAGEGLHRLGYQYYTDGKTTYVTEHADRGNWVADLTETFAGAIDSPDRGSRMGKPLCEKEVRDLCDVEDDTNHIYTMLKFFLSPMDADNWWVRASESSLSDIQWWEGIVKSPVHSALCWLIGGAPARVPDEAPPDQEHQLHPYYVRFAHASAPRLHNGGGWTTKALSGSPRSRAVLAVKEQIDAYWALEDDIHTFCVLTEDATDLYNTLMVDSDHVDPDEYGKRKAEAYAKAMEEQEPAAKKQRGIALTPTTQGSSSTPDSPLGDGSSIESPMLLD